MTDVDDVFAATVPVDGDKPRKAAGAKRKLLTVVLPVVPVLAVIGGGVTYTSVTVAAADRTAPTIVWENPDPKTETKDPAELTLTRGKSSTPLSKLLLPVPSGFQLGPDIEGYGNDGELAEKDAVALLKSEGKGLAGKKRREYEKQVERLGVQGIAVRSFASEDGDLVVDVHITRMKNKSRIRDMYKLRTGLAELLGFPEGPKIKDHKNSACSLMPQSKEGSKKEKAEQLDGMVCVAYDSENLVAVTAAGAKPFDKSAVAALVKKQLDHIKSPGEYV
ncbi:hypothetical protein [Streptomyces formicae]|uniref:hypothetical protein n=1 Tax=Streptomyces formicae TaxID=1616117 RepID=UPI001F55F5C4|nr:hypothetical protein [Streptomyces formicae]